MGEANEHLLRKTGLAAPGRLSLCFDTSFSECLNLLVMKKRVNDAVNTKERDPNRDNENAAVSRATYVPLGILATVISIWAIIRLCQLYVPAKENTKAAIDALVGFFTLVVIIVQSVILKRQWQAMQEALKRTDTLIEQNKVIVQAAQRQARAAEASLTLAQKHFEMAERPSLGIEQFQFPDDHGFVVAVVKNFGKSPAKNAYFQITANWYINTPPLPDRCPEPQRVEVAYEGSRTIIPPQGGYAVRVHVPDAIAEQIQTGTVLLYCWVEGTYESFGGGKYFIEGYSRFLAARNTWEACPIHNDAN